MLLVNPSRRRGQPFRQSAALLLPPPLLLLLLAPSGDDAHPWHFRSQHFTLSAVVD